MDKKVWRWLYRVPGHKRLYIVALSLLQALVGASGVLYALLLRNIVDAAAGHDTAGFWRYVYLIVLLSAAQLALRAVLRWLNELSRSSLENIFKQRLLRQLLTKDYATVSAVHSGEWLNRLTSDTVVVANGYTEILPGLIGMVVKLVSALVMIIALDRRFASILIPGGLALAVLTYAFRRVLKRLHKNVQEKDGALRIFLQERIGSMLVLRSFAAQSQTEAAAGERMEEHKAARMRRNRFSNICNIGFGAAMSGMYLFGICYCAHGILTGTISYGTLTAITQLITQIQSPFANITGYLPRLYAMAASGERLMEIEAFPDECTQEALSLDEVNDYYRRSFASLELRGAAFTYYPAVEGLEALSKEAMPTVLRDLTLSLPKGETLAFTGASGCGKSTVLKLLMCLYDLDAGERILRDTAGGTQPLTPRWHRLFAYVPQGNHLMSGTISEVVSFADASRAREDESLWAALRIACADGFVSELENGLDTLLGERGAGLSEGQMQRIAIARAVFAASPILLLDEATSALDGETEKQLLENLRRMTDKTVVIVTHRPAALEICDRVFQFTEGGIQEL